MNMNFYYDLIVPEYWFNKSLWLAEAILQSLQSPYPEGHAISIESRDGDGPQQDPKEWKLRFASVA